MAGALPDGEPVPQDGSLPGDAAANAGKNGFAVYVHVPFCASRCGYCDFNTYTASELGGGESREAYPDTVLSELKLAKNTINLARVGTVFVGGGTPTLLGAAHPGPILDAIDNAWGLATNA